MSLAFAFALPTLAVAADPTTNFVPLASYNNTPLQSVYSSPSLASYISGLFTMALSLGAILAVVRLVWAGYNYMGSDMWSSKQKARDIIVDVVWGMMLLLGTYLILYQINPCILNLSILQTFGSGGSTCSY